MPLGWQNHKATPAPNVTEDWADHEIHHYHFAHWFEFSVELINTGAGLLIIFALFLGVINLFIVAYNAATGREAELVNPLHSGHGHVATVVAIRLMLGELTALALAVLVAADVVETVIKPTHAYEMNVVIKMGFITVLRTGLAYFLAKEIKEQEEVHINLTRSKSSLGLDRQGVSREPSSFGGFGMGLANVASSSGRPSPPGTPGGGRITPAGGSLWNLSSQQQPGPGAAEGVSKKDN